MSIGDGLKRLLGGKSAKKAAPKKMAVSACQTSLNERAALIEWAVKMRRAKAPMARGMIDQTLIEMRANPPKLGDTDALARVLKIHRAEHDLRRLMNHRDWRYLVLTGLRELMMQTPEPAKTQPDPAKRPTKVVIKR